jgi:hypothetical protein
MIIIKICQYHREAMKKETNNIHIEQASKKEENKKMVALN